VRPDPVRGRLAVAVERELFVFAGRLPRDRDDVPRAFFGAALRAVVRFRAELALRVVLFLRAVVAFRGVLRLRVVLRLRAPPFRRADGREVFRDPPRPAFLAFLATSTS
jgi:hypothetical protein